ncbi:uncharacterized protein [Watersipora subatra]
MYEEAKEALAPMLGIWKCDNSRSEQIIEVFKEMGLRPVVGERSDVNDPFLNLHIDDGKLVAAMTQPFNSKTSVTRLDGSSSPDSIIGGGSAKSYFDMVDGTPVVTTKPDDKNIKPYFLTRHMVNGELVQKVKVVGGKAVAVRYFVRQD